MVGVPGLEPGTSSLSGTRSNQLSYTPIKSTPEDSADTFYIMCKIKSTLYFMENTKKMVELQGLEPWTSSLQSWRSSQLSYSPVIIEN